jgi:putative ABC transport system ATP-binding protein
MTRQEQDTPLIRLEKIGVTRRNRGGDEVVVLHDISFSALRGKVTGIVGPSGGGKSTLLRLVNRLEEPTTGCLLLDGEDMARLDPLALRRRVAMVPQKPFMFQGTVLFNLQQPFRYRSIPPPVAGSGEVARSLELARISTELLERDARTLSGGEQQRVSLARALISSPQVLLLDEPTSALDRPSTDKLAVMLHDICRLEQLAIMLVTHDLRLAGQLADVLIYLERGRILEEGVGGEMLAQPRSEAFRSFLAEPEKV